MLRIDQKILDADLQETLQMLNRAAIGFRNQAEICGYCSGLPEVESLLTADRLNQFVAISKAITYPLKEINFNMAELMGSVEATDEQARLTQCWITLGAIIEAAMKIWLAIYYQDFSSSSWRKWSINEHAVLTDLDVAIDELNSRGELDGSQAQSLKDTVREALKKRRDVPDLDIFDFLEMLRFFKKVVRWEQATVDYINMIRGYRNSIHAFTPRSIGKWNELLDALHFTCALLDELTSCTPDCTDQLSAIAEYQAAMRSEMY